MAPAEMTALALGQRSWLAILWNAIRGKGISHGVSVKTVPTPTIESSELLVKVYSVACNPADVAHIDYVGPAFAIIGYDWSGIVEEVGTEASGWKVGDRIAGVVYGNTFPDIGAFAQYLKVPFDLAWKPPSTMSHQQAATYGVSAATAMQGLYTQLDVPWPDSNIDMSSTPTKRTILIYAGSATTSIFAIQLAKVAGYEVVTTCSPHNFELVKSYGADAVYDYHSASALEEIKKNYPTINRAYDGISVKESAKFCSSVVEKSGGKVVVLTPVKLAKKPGVEVIFIFALTLFGKAFAILPPFGPKHEAVPSDREALVRFYKILPGLLEKVKPPPVQVVPGGFDALLEALDLLRKKQVSGKKIVVDLV